MLLISRVCGRWDMEIKNVCIDSVLSVKHLQCSCPSERVAEYDKLFVEDNASTQGVRRLQ